MTLYYIAGPMTGYPDANYAAFDAEERRLNALGIDVISPVQMNRENGVPGDEAAAVSSGPEHFNLCMRRDVGAILLVDGIVLLDGWERSTGTFVEMTVAFALGLKILYAGTLAPVPASVLQAHLKLPGYRAPKEEAA